jgi:hypothetical protein
VETYAFMVSEFLPMWLYEWQRQFGSRVMVHSDGSITPVPVPRCA